MKRLLLVIAALSTLAAGCGKDGSKSPAVGDSEADSLARMEIVLARVGNVEITGNNVRDHMLKRSGPDNVDKYINNPDILQVALSALVDQYVWAQVAQEEGVELNSEDRRKVMNLESELLASKYVADVVEKKAKPSPAEIEAYYNENQARFIRPVTVAARHILVATRERADAIQKELEGGGDFTALALRYSQDETTKNTGGALGYVRAGKRILPIGRDRDFEQTVLALNEGETGVVQTSMGFHVVKAEKKEGGDIKPRDEVSDEIMELLYPKQIGRVYNEELTKARERLGVHYVTENFEKFTGMDNNTRRLLELAAAIDEPRNRAEAYRRLAFDFPDAQEAPEALFRMGYIQLVNESDKKTATGTFRRITAKYPKSRWKRAANFMLENIDMDPASLGTIEEVLALALEQDQGRSK